MILEVLGIRHCTVTEVEGRGIFTPLLQVFDDLMKTSRLLGTAHHKTTSLSKMGSVFTSMALRLRFYGKYNSGNHSPTSTLSWKWSELPPFSRMSLWDIVN